MSMKSSITVQVAAPASLQEGSTFKAQVDGSEFMVTVPTGGVEKDEIFSVPYPIEMEGDKTSSYTDSPKEFQLVPTSCEAVDVSHYEKHHAFNHGPTGQWRTDLCDCMCIMGLFCPTILMAQVMERNKFDYCGRPITTGPTKPVCMVFTLITFCWVPLAWILPNTTKSVNIVLIVNILSICWGFFLICVFTSVRMSMRQKYNIRPACTDSDCCIEDCCTAYWCTCCSAIQLANHTHNRMEYKNRYKMYSTTGLSHDASEVV